MSMDVEDVAIRLRSALGPEGVITDRQRLRTYECDGLAHYKVMPAIVVLPRTTEQVAAVVRTCIGRRFPLWRVAEAQGFRVEHCPVAGGVLIVLVKMRGMLEVDLENLRAVVEPGVVNLDLSQAAAHGLYFVPDPSARRPVRSAATSARTLAVPTPSFTASRPTTFSAWRSLRPMARWFGSGERHWTFQVTI